jgi:hypothetical protein
MWSAIAGLLLSVFKWIWGGEKESEGEQLGRTEQENASLTEELKDVQKANSAASSVSSDRVSINDDPENRDGPNYKSN